MSDSVASQQGTAPAPPRTPPARPQAGSALQRVLVVEDEPGIVDFISRGLAAEGYEVQAALDGVEGERLALSGEFDAVVLDLMLPGRNGMEVLRTLRRAMPRLPVIVLTARAEIEDRVEGLDAGAFDYLVKPFSMAELAARVRAHMRAVTQASTSVVEAEGIQVDLLTRRVTRGDRSVALSTTEFELLVYLMRHDGQVVSREQILAAVWGYEHDPTTNVVDVYIGYLRRKLALGSGAAESGASGPVPIHTVRAVGYRFGGRG